jgi:hypothetical protein
MKSIFIYFLSTAISLSFINAQTFDALDTGLKVIDEEIFTIAVADMNGDGWVDLIGNKQNSGPNDTLCFWLNNGDLSFSGSDVIDNQLSIVSSIEAKDLDNDLDVDVLITDFLDKKVIWYENLGSLNFSEPNVLLSSSNTIGKSHALDIDNDGDLDVIASVGTELNTYWIENEGEGSFLTPEIISEIPDRARFFDSKDLDGDGDFDLAFASSQVPYLGVLENINNTTYQLDSINDTNMNSDFVGVEVLIEDFDGDEVLDLLAVYQWSVGLFRNVGNIFVGETIQTNIVVLGSNTYRSAQIADFDKDGDYDFTVIDFEQRELGETTCWIRIFDNDGDGNFENPISYRMNKVYHVVRVLDVDNDNDLDIIASHSPSFSFPSGSSGLKGVDVFINHYVAPPCDTLIVEIEDSFELGATYQLIDETLVSDSGYYEVVVIDEVCATKYLYQLSTFVISGLNPHLNSYPITLSPNPAGSFTILKFGQTPNFNYDVEIVDISGKTIQYFSNLLGSQFHIQNIFEKGIYLVNVYQTNSKNWLGSTQLVIQ